MIRPAVVYGRCQSCIRVGVIDSYLELVSPPPLNEQSVVQSPVGGSI